MPTTRNSPDGRRVAYNRLMGVVRGESRAIATRIKPLYLNRNNGEPCWVRTSDLLIKSFFKPIF